MIIYYYGHIAREIINEIATAGSPVLAIFFISIWETCHRLLESKGDLIEKRRDYFFDSGLEKAELVQKGMKFDEEFRKSLEKHTNETFQKEYNDLYAANELWLKRFLKILYLVFLLFIYDFISKFLVNDNVSFVLLLFSVSTLVWAIAELKSYTFK